MRNSSTHTDPMATTTSSMNIMTTGGEGATTTPSLSSADNSDGEEGTNSSHHSNHSVTAILEHSVMNNGGSVSGRSSMNSTSHTTNYAVVGASGSPLPVSQQQHMMHTSASMNSLNSTHSNNKAAGGPSRRQIFLRGGADLNRQISGDGSVTLSPGNRGGGGAVPRKQMMKTITLKLVKERPKKNRRRSVSDLAVSFSTLNRSFRSSIVGDYGGSGGSSNSISETTEALNATVEPQLKKPSVDFTTVSEVTVSWFDGTTSDELYRHVEASISKALGEDILDFHLLSPLEHSKPPQEVVLSPCIPHGSTFLVKFTVAPPARVIYRPPNTPPESPSAAPDPSPIVSFRKRTAGVAGTMPMPLSLDGNPINGTNPAESSSSNAKYLEPRVGGAQQQTVQAQVVSSSSSSGNAKQQATPIIMGKKGERVIVVTQTGAQEKKHVIFNLANYFVLFLSIIAISAELAERAPDWIEENIAQVNQCAVDQETLFECINNGDVAGVIAAFSLWIAKSQATKRMFLFGFQSVNQLWTVVYESFVTAFCWGFSYMFIRRGLNPDSRERFLSRYWKDAVYGSMAGFNASFMKSVMKNLIPKEVIEEAVMETKQLRLVDWIVRAGRDA